MAQNRPRNWPQSSPIGATRTAVGLSLPPFSFLSVSYFDAAGVDQGIKMIPSYPGLVPRASREGLKT